MPEFLTTHATAAKIENIILDSSKTLVLVSPYIRLSTTLFRRLKDADERGVKIIVVYGKEALKIEEKKQLESLKNLKLFFCERLHTKCYFNDDSMVITSMNLFDFSEKNNREMGVLFKRLEDVSIFKDAIREVQSIIKESEKETRNPDHFQEFKTTPDRAKIPVPPPDKRNVAEIIKNTLNTVFSGEKLDARCIRCGDGIPFDPIHALCDACYYEWSDYKNPSYPEHYCHACGKQSKTTKDKPLCYSCFSRLGK